MPVTLLTISDWGTFAICDIHIFQTQIFSHILKLAIPWLKSRPLMHFCSKKFFHNLANSHSSTAKNEQFIHAIWINYHFMWPIIIACRGASGCNPTQAGAWSGQPTVGWRPPAQVPCSGQCKISVHINFQIFFCTLHFLSVVLRWTRGKVLFCH